MKILFVLFVFVPFLSSTHELGKWEQVKDKDGIKMFTRHSETSKFNDIRIETELVGNLSQIASILIDVEKYPDWAYATKSCALIKKISDNEVIYYSEFSTPWPVSNRDLYAHCKITLDSVSHSLKVISVGMKDYQVENKNLVRIPFSNGSWDITATSDKTMHLEYVLELNPGGSVPAWVMNMFASKGPMETFLNLKLKMQQLNSYKN
jgi:hypothetical protein